MVKGLMGQLDSRSRAVRKQSGAWALPWVCSASPRPLHASWARLWVCTASRNTFSPKPTRPIRTNNFPCTQAHRDETDIWISVWTCVCRGCVVKSAWPVSFTLQSHNKTQYDKVKAIYTHLLIQKCYAGNELKWNADMIPSGLLTIFFLNFLTILHFLILHSMVNIFVWVSRCFIYDTEYCW